jgi:hypothetical protein
MNIHPRVKLVLKLTVTVALFVAVATTVGWSKIGAALLAASPQLVVASWLIGLVGRFGQALQMSAIMCRAGIPVATPRVFLANSLSALYGLVVPGDLAAGFAKWAHLSALTGKRSLVLTCMVYNRFMLMSPWLLGGLIAASIRNPWGSTKLLVTGIALATLVIVGFALFYHPRCGPFIDRAIMAVTRRVLPHALHERVEYVFGALSPFRRSSWTSHLRFFATASAIVSIGLAAQLTMAAAVGVNIGLLDYIWIAAILTLLRQLPITFHGIGVREAGLVVLLGEYGVPGEIAFSFGVLLSTHLLIFALVGLVYQIVLFAKRNDEAE